MYAKIMRAGRMAGLLAYLAGPGRSDEHTDPHLVAGSSRMEFVGVGRVLDQADAQQVARWLDGPARSGVAPVRRGVYERVAAGMRDGAGQRVMERVKVEETDAHVYHIALAVRPEEGAFDDAEWAQVAHAFVAKMGIADPVDGTAATTRWVAVRHGTSAKGNDHIHLAINMTREDGSVVDVNRNYAKAAAACRQIEDEFGLEPLHPNAYELARTYARASWEKARRAEMTGPDSGTARIPWAELDEAGQQRLIAAECGSDAEWAEALAGRDVHAEANTRDPQAHRAAREAAGRQQARAAWNARVDAGEESRAWTALTRAERDRLTAAATPTEDPRRTLARTVRAAATASADEAEFVRRLRRAGLIVRPRYARGRTDVVEGYSVAGRPPAGGRPIWRGGGRLGKDLTLPRLRAEAGWTDTPENAVAAAAEWTAAGRRARVTRAGRETYEVDPQAGRDAHAMVAAWRDRLQAIPVEDTDTWARVARAAAGSLAAYSAATEAEPGDLAAASDALARSARTRQPAARPAPDEAAAVSNLAMVLAVAGPGHVTVLDTLMMRELLGLTQLVWQAETAAHDAKQADRLLYETRSRLVRVRDALPQPAPAEDPASGGRAAEAAALARLGHGVPLGKALRDVDPGRPAHAARPERNPQRGRDDGLER